VFEEKGLCDQILETEGRLLARVLVIQNVGEKSTFSFHNVNLITEYFLFRLFMLLASIY